MSSNKVSGIYENGVIHFHSTVRLGRKLPLRNRTRLMFTLELPRERDPVVATAGIIHVPKRIARLIIESPEFSVVNS